MASQTCWGVEVGSGGLKAVKLARDGEGVAVLEFVIIPHKRPLSAPEIDAKDAMRLAVGTLISQYDLSKSSLAISVPGGQSFARFAKLPPVEAKKIPDIVKFEAAQQIPFPIDEVQWDYQTFAQSDSPEVEVGIFAIRTESVMEVLQSWQDVGRVPEIITLSPLAAYNAIAWDQNFSEQTPGTVILDVGTTSTDLIVAEAGRMWIRTFPVGGHQFTESLVAGFNLSYVKAEKLKGEAESNQHARQILQAMRPVFADLAGDVQRSIGYYNSLHKDAKLARVIGLGSTFGLPGLRKFLSQQLGFEVVKHERFNKVTKVAGDREADFQANASQLATAFGLALQGLGLETINANLMPTSVVRESMWASKKPWFIGAAVLAALAGGAMFIGPMMDKSAFAGSAPRVISDVTSEKQQLTQKWKTASEEYQADTRAGGLLQLVDARDAMPRILDDVGTMLNDAKGKLAAIRSSEGKPGVGKPFAEPMISLVGFDTAYVTATEGDASGGGAGAGGAGGADPAAAGGRGKFANVLVIEVNRPAVDADAFVQEHFQNWLNKNNHRHALYDIVDARWQVNGRRDIPVGDPTDGSGGGSGGGSPGIPAQPPGGGDGGGRGGAGGGLGGGGFGGGGGRVPGGLPGGPRPPSNPGGGPGGGPGGAPVDGGDADKLAPLPVLKSMESPGVTVTTYEITWTSKLRDPAVARDAGKGEGKNEEPKK